MYELAGIMEKWLQGDIFGYQWLQEYSVIFALEGQAGRKSLWVVMLICYEISCEMHYRVRCLAQLGGGKNAKLQILES